MKTTDVKLVEQKINELFAEFEKLSTDESGQLLGGVSTIDLADSPTESERKNYFQCGCNNYQCNCK